MLDENVRIELSRFLVSQGFDVKLSQKGSSDAYVASLSLKEKRILVTNDEDFSGYTHDTVFSVVLLKIPQSDPKALLVSFGRLISEYAEFSGKLVVVFPSAWKDFPLPKKSGSSKTRYG